MRKVRVGKQLRRIEVKAQRAAARSGDVEAAERILSHSCALGHERLSVRRYLLARAYGSTKLEPFRSYCERVAAQLSADELEAMARDAAELVAKNTKSGESGR